MENGGTLVKAVRLDGYGGVDVLKVVDVPKPEPGPGQVLVQVKAAGINPGEDKIRSGLLHDRWRLPSPRERAVTSRASWPRPVLA